MAAQLIPSHSAAMECYRRAMIGDQMFRGPSRKLEPSRRQWPCDQYRQGSHHHGSDRVRGSVTIPSRSASSETISTRQHQTALAIVLLSADLLVQPIGDYLRYVQVVLLQHHHVTIAADTKFREFDVHCWNTRLL